MQVELILLVLSLLFFASIFTDRIGYKFGIPALFLFLAVGMLFGPDGLGKLVNEEGVNSLSSGGHFVDLGHSEVAVHHESERAGNRRCAHDQHVGVLIFLRQKRALIYTESVDNTIIRSDLQEVMSQILIKYMGML